MNTPTYYDNVSEISLKVKEKYNLTDTQTLLYNHICRGDFKLRNEDGQLFYDENNKGFGWSGDRTWVKNQLKPLIKSGIVKFQKVYDCVDGKYTSWYFYSPEHDFNDLIDADCYVSTWKLAMIKYYLRLEDGFNKKNKKYNNIEFIYDESKSCYQYTFKYKGESSIYNWDYNECGKKQSTRNTPLYYDSFQEMIHDIWSFLEHDGYKEITNIPNYTEERKFTI